MIFQMNKFRSNIWFVKLTYLLQYSSFVANNTIPQGGKVIKKKGLFCLTVLECHGPKTMSAYALLADRVLWQHRILHGKSKECMCVPVFLLVILFLYRHQNSIGGLVCPKLYLILITPQRPTAKHYSQIKSPLSWYLTMENRVST
jgi:hypothetical protein